MNRILQLLLGSMIASSCLPHLNKNDDQKSADTATLKDVRDDDVTAIFHPVDPSLEIIASEILKPHTNIDIAMYSLDTSPTNPVMTALASEAIQSRIADGTLKIRLIFEGYGTAADATARSQSLENVNVDVRWFSSARKVHHKFATIDSASENATLITGSANWSLGSMNNYDEAIVVMHHKPGIATAFQKEFNLLWALSTEFGEGFNSEPAPVGETSVEAGLSVAFNSANYSVAGDHLETITPKVWTLTHFIVDEIDHAQSSLEIATTRIVLRPIYNAILKAAARGVKVNILVNQDQYELPNNRMPLTIPECSDEYEPECSVSALYPWFLTSQDYPGKENVTVRVKFFSLNTHVTLAKQMHAKYLIADSQHIMSGSFNWSAASEYQNIENVVKIEGAQFPNVMAKFSKNHANIFSQGRDQYQPYVTGIERAIVTGVKIDCKFAPMALTFQEIDFLLDSGQRAGNKPFKNACL
jgi:phosphatidylserine/phosphatidylglycerophosphate/cardiolipin synthase-like enzyme